MSTDTQIVANIRMMLDHFDKVDNRFELSNVLGEVQVLVEWTGYLLNGAPYDWRQFTVDVLTQQYWDNNLSGRLLDEYKKEIGYHG